MKTAVQVLVGVLMGFLLAGVVLLVARMPAGKPVTLEAPPTKVPIEVHVIGAVLRPGVYLFSEGSRVQDAVAAAGGLTDQADLNSLNLAAKLTDGQQLNIPNSGGAGAGPQPTAQFEVLPGDITPTASAANLININTASSTELQTLPGIGPATAEQIIRYRTEHGPFQQIEDIMNVAGIGPATFDSIQTLITVR
jgi:competence protein ComEA